MEISTISSIMHRLGLSHKLQFYFSNMYWILWRIGTKYVPSIKNIEIAQNLIFLKLVKLT